MATNKFTFVLILLIASCGVLKADGAEFFIKHENKYSDSFLKEFKKRHSIYETVSLLNDTIVVNNDKEDFVLIPTDLPLNVEVVYEAEKETDAHTLKVKRINISTLEYSYIRKNNGRITEQKQGEAHLEIIFYYGAQGTFEDEDGITYGMNKYYMDDYEKNDYLLIGVGNIEKSSLHMQTDNGEVGIPFTRTK
jgi:diphthamide synthase subunit DPH2